MDISNKTLAIFLVAAIAISLFGSILSLNKLGQYNKMLEQQKKLTGYATSSGLAKVNITSAESLIFSIQEINFGEGTVNGSDAGMNCTLYADLAQTTTWKEVGPCINFSENMPSPLTIENNGNKNLTITMNVSHNGTEFIGGGAAGIPAPQFQYKVEDGEAGACVTTAQPAAYVEVNRSLQHLICGNLLAVDGSDIINVSVMIRIPLDAPAGAKVATFLATGTS